eukprot:6853425-Pyramimonas_sp.AAC.1
MAICLLSCDTDTNMPCDTVVKDKAKKFTAEAAERLMPLHGTCDGAKRYPEDPYWRTSPDGCPTFRLFELLDHWTIKPWFSQPKASFEKTLATAMTNSTVQMDPQHLVVEETMEEVGASHRQGRRPVSGELQTGYAVWHKFQRRGCCCEGYAPRRDWGHVSRWTRHIRARDWGSISGAQGIFGIRMQEETGRQETVHAAPSPFP